MQFSIDDPRGAARQIVRESIDSALWEQNEAFTRQLVEKIQAHRLHHHPIVAAWDKNEFTREALKIVHLEIRAGFLEIFTESLLRLMQTTAQLEPKLGAKAKMAARFLVQINVLEEIGFKPDGAKPGDFAGHPGYSHYWQLTNTLEALGAPEATWASYQRSPEALATRATLEENQDDHLRLAAVLAAIETVFMPYYSPWGRNTIAVCPAIDVPDGYHTIHVEDDAGHFVDDDHSEDSWYVVRQALTPDRYAEIEAMTMESLEIWARLMDMLVNKNLELKRAA